MQCTLVHFFYFPQAAAAPAVVGVGLLGRCCDVIFHPVVVAVRGALARAAAAIVVAQAGVAEVVVAAGM